MANNNNKVTNKEMFTILADIVKAVGIPEAVSTSVTPDEINDWIELKIEQLSKRATTMTKAQKEKAEQNNTITDKILNVLEANPDGVKVTGIIKADPYFVENEISTQRVTALLKKLVESGEVVRNKVKNETFYKLNEGEAPLVVEGE